MKLRKIPIAGKIIQQMRQTIHDTLHTEENTKNLITKIECNKERKDAMIRIMTFIPCILCMENRVGLKL